MLVLNIKKKLYLSITILDNDTHISQRVVYLLLLYSIYFIAPIKVCNFWQCIDRSDKCRRPASSLADISTLVIQSIFILKYHIHACTFSIPVCSPIKCYLKCQSNGHLYNFTTFINENKIHFSDTVKVNKKS